MVNELEWHERGKCASCGSMDLLLEREIGGIALVRCSYCRFLQADKILSPQSMQELYRVGYDGLRPKQGQQINALIAKAAIDRFGIWPHLDGNALDVGCGYGYFMHAVQGRIRGQIAGLELSEAERSFGQKSFGLEIESSIDDLAPQFTNNLSFISALEVIEHLPSPKEFLDEMKMRLKSGGLLMIATDNFASFPAKIMGNAFPKWIPHQHISLFDAESLPALITRVDGLEIVSCLSFNPWELIARTIVFRASARKFGGRTFELESEMQTESDRPFHLFRLRKRINQFWFRVTAAPNLNGEMMFIIARRT